MQTTYAQLALVIPSLEPSEHLVDYVLSLRAQGFCHIYVVNDGSDTKYDAIFQPIGEMEGCILLSHGKNKGKGAALKTAFAVIARDFPQCRGVITADSDGQHAVADVCRLAHVLLEKGGLILGERAFSPGNTPLKSYVGNRMSSLLFFLLHGKWVGDTQTGLRGFDASLLPEMRAIEGTRFEYEMAVLTSFAKKKLPMYFITIDTIYIAGNVSSHFRPLLDSLQIGGVLLGRLWRFLMSSGVSCIIDVSMYWLLIHLLTPVISLHLLRIGLSVVLARMLSMLVNYTINKGYVFHEKSDGKGSFRRYVMLVVANMAAATVAIYALRTLLHIDERLAKVAVDLVLLTMNYQLQRLWVFPTAKQEENSEQQCRNTGA